MNIIKFSAFDYVLVLSFDNISYV